LFCEEGVTFTAANLFGQILFGAIGLAAFVYGKKQSSFKTMLLAVAIMGFPYVVSETWMLYAIGGVLTSLLFIWRD
jgi:hypothetical protein